MTQDLINAILILIRFAAQNGDTNDEQLQDAISLLQDHLLAEGAEFVDENEADDPDRKIGKDVDL